MVFCHRNISPKTDGMPWAEDGTQHGDVGHGGHGGTQWQESADLDQCLLAALKDPFMHLEGLSTLRNVRSERASLWEAQPWWQS